MALQGWRGPRLKIERAFSRFRANRDGATAVEFAMVSVPFLGLLFAIFETAFVFFVTEATESATAEAARQIMTAQAQGKYTTSTQFRDNVICPTATGTKSLIPSFIKCSNLIVDIRTVGAGGASTTFAGADLSKASMIAPGFTPKYCIGVGGDIVVVRVLYPMPVYLSILSATSMTQVSQSTSGQTNYTSADGAVGYKHVLMATAAFQNEPFSGASVAAGC